MGVKRFGHFISFDIAFSQNRKDLRQKMGFMLETNMSNRLKVRNLTKTTRHGFRGCCIEADSRSVSGDDRGARGFCYAVMIGSLRWIAAG
jgi:hypothetical protein